MTRPHILLLTETRHRQLPEDEHPLIEALEHAGCTVEAAVWSEPVPDADLALIRSTWDYTHQPHQFLTALEQLAQRMPVWNPVGTVRWNADKRYLLELRDQGLPIPASTVVSAGQSPSLGAVAREVGSDDLVIKPVIGASGVDTWRSTPDAEARWAEVVGRRDLLVQRFVPEVVTEGEWSLVFIAGTFSHAVLKRAATGEFRVQEQYGGRALRRDPPASLLRGAERVLAATTHAWLYARVDGVQVAGAFVLMELELIEPSLFFGLAPEAATALALALVQQSQDLPGTPNDSRLTTNDSRLDREPH